MTVESTVVIGLSVLIGLVGFFLQAFFKQVQEVVKDVKDIKIQQAENTEKLNGFERRIQLIEAHIFKNM